MAKKRKNKKRGRKPPQHVLIEAVSTDQEGASGSPAADDPAQEQATAASDSAMDAIGESADPTSASDLGSPSEDEVSNDAAEDVSDSQVANETDEADAESDGLTHGDDVTEDKSADESGDEPDESNSSDVEPVAADQAEEASPAAAGDTAAEDTAAEDTAAADTAAEDTAEDSLDVAEGSDGDAAGDEADSTEDEPDPTGDEADSAEAAATEDSANDHELDDEDSEDTDDGEDGSAAGAPTDADDSGAAPGEEAPGDDQPTINLGADPFGLPDQIEGDATANCLWCGAERPVEEAVCPACQHAWIDATIAEARGGQLEALSAQQPAPQPTRPWWRRAWIPIVLAVAAAAVYAAIFWVMWDGTGPDEPAAATTQATLPTTVAPTTAPPSTTAAPVTTTTSTSTTSTTSTTTTTTTTLPPIAVVEPPYQPGDLTLGAFALGPISFGSTDADVPGRLAATFGQPTAQFPVGENWGLCPDDTARALEFGHLSIILRSEPSGEAVVGYRLRSETSGGDDDQSATLESISGLGLGDTLSDAQALYSVVATSELDDGTPIFLVLRSSDRRTLLWGELSSAADPEVLSINSPRPCDGGPFGP